MKVAVSVIDAAGHMNPMLALASELMAKGHHVRFFHHTPANVDTVRGLKFVEGENYSFELLWEAGDDFDYKKHIPAIEDQDEHEINVADMILAGFSRVPEFMPRYLAAYERYKPDGKSFFLLFQFRVSPRWV